MNTLKRHYLIEFFKLLAIVSGGLAITFSLLDLFEALDDLLPHNPSFGQLMTYAALHIPKNTLFLLPMGVLLSSLFTVGKASRSKELVAVMASGGRIKSLFAPFILTGVLLSLVAFVISEFAVPTTMLEAKYLARSIKNKKSHSIYKDGSMWVRAADGALVNIDLYVEHKNLFKGMSIYSLDDNGITKIIKADEAEYLNGDWVLKDVSVFDTSTGAITKKERFSFPQLGPPEVFSEEIKKPKEMGMIELARYLKKLEDTGFKNNKLNVEMHSKASFPVINLIMIVLGVSLSARRAVGGLVATAIGLVVSLLYYFGYTLMLSIGYTGIVPPIIAVWTMPIIFFIIAAYLFRSIPE